MSDPEAGSGDDTDESALGDAETDGGGDGPPNNGGDGHPSDGGNPPDPSAEPEGGPAGSDGPRSDLPDPPEGPPPGDPRETEPSPETPIEWVTWFFRTDHGAVVYLREVVSSVGAVLLVGLILFGVSGLWPPMVAVESGSMYPHMQRGDLVFVMEEHRLAPDAAYAETGVVTYETGERTGYTKFKLAGDVIVYQPGGNDQVTPIIHRARFWVNESENWVANGKADPDALGGADTCGGVSNCPAPYAGFITKGDNNGRYDQVSGLSGPVKPAWIVGTAEFRIPWLGEIRLWAGETAAPGVGAGATTVQGTADHVTDDTGSILEAGVSARERLERWTTPGTPAGQHRFSATGHVGPATASG